MDKIEQLEIKVHETEKQSIEHGIRYEHINKSLEKIENELHLIRNDMNLKTTAIEEKFDAKLKDFRAQIIAVIGIFLTIAGLIIKLWK